MFTCPNQTASRGVQQHIEKHISTLTTESEQRHTVSKQKRWPCLVYASFLQAPEGRPEVRALWAWLQLRLALSLLAFHQTDQSPPTSPMELAVVANPDPGEPAVAEAGTEVAGGGSKAAGGGHAIFGHVEGLLEAMGFWGLFREVVQAGKPKAACSLLQQTFVQLNRAGLLR